MSQLPSSVELDGKAAGRPARTAAPRSPATSKPREQGRLLANLAEDPDGL
jgi:hypothetical protein